MQLLLAAVFSHQGVVQLFSHIVHVAVHAVSFLMSFRVWIVVALMVASQGARVSSRESGPDCLPNGDYWYASESEHNKQKLMEDLGCYCKKAGKHLRCSSLFRSTICVNSFQRTLPKTLATSRLAPWVTFWGTPLTVTRSPGVSSTQVASMGDCPSTKQGKRYDQPERTRWFHAEAPAFVSLHHASQ